MKKEWLLLIGSVTVTLLVALGLIRWFAPTLLGIPADLQMVQVSEEVSPFYQGVFRREDYRSQEFMLKDPVTRVRPRPLHPDLGGLGPHDLLGFRNLSVPNVADIVVIGDSQTYGNNAWLEQNWPSVLQRSLAEPRPSLYAMAVGGWGAVQYLDMFQYAMAFLPRVVVVAFYTGNDPLESFVMAYNVDGWASLRPNTDLDASDVPRSPFPPSPSDIWAAEFADGTLTGLTPKLRLVSNQDHSAVDAGYEIMARVGEEISSSAEGIDVKLVFTIIPTKELVFSARVEREGIEAPAEYRELIVAERERIAWLEARFAQLRNVTYVDVVSPLQQAALEDAGIYPQDANGHPLAPGYDVIGRTIAAVVGGLVPSQGSEVVAVQTDAQRYMV